MYWLFATVFTLLAYYDAKFTRARIAEVGVEVELNPVIQWLVRRIGLFGVDVGIVVPTMAIAIAGTYESHILSFALGVRFFLFLLQYRVRSLG